MDAEFASTRRLAAIKVYSCLQFYDWPEHGTGALGSPVQLAARRCATPARTQRGRLRRARLFIKSARVQAREPSKVERGQRSSRDMRGTENMSAAASAN